MHKRIKVYAVHRKNDERAAGPITDVCATYDLAVRVARGAGWYGGDAPVIERNAIEVDGDTFLIDRERPNPIRPASTIDDVEMEQEAKERAEAIAKLTPRERALLGL